MAPSLREANGCTTRELWRECDSKRGARNRRLCIGMMMRGGRMDNAQSKTHSMPGGQQRGVV